MGSLQTIFKSIGDRFRAKRYLGILPGTLPSNLNAWSKGDFLNALNISLYTNRAVAKRAEKVGEIEFILHDKNGEEVERDPLLDLLYRPNAVFTGPQFWALAQTYYDAVGEVYIFLEGTRELFESTRKITAMHLLNPTQMKPVFSAEGKPEKYEYKTTEKTVEYKPHQILYVHRPDPQNPLRGISLLKAGVNAIQTEAQISTYHARILENGGKVEGVFTFKTGPLTKEQVGEIKDQYQKEYSQAKKAGLPLFLGGDAKYEKTGLTPDELAFLEAKKMSFEDICVMTGVPKSMLASTNDVKFDNADADRAIFLRETIKPLLTLWTTVLDEVLFPDDQTLTFRDPTPENVEQKRKNIDTVSKLRVMTTNELRKLVGEIGIELDDMDGGDEIPAPAVAPAPGDNSNTDTNKALTRRRKAIEHPLKDAETRRIYWEVAIKRLDAREERFKRVLGAYLDDQKERLTQAIDPAKLRYFRKAKLDDLLSLELEVKIGREMFLPVLTQLLRDSGEDGMDLAGSDYSFNLGAEIASWLDKKTDVFLRTINETTFEKLKEEFAESLAAEETRDQLVGRIRDAYSDITKARAVTIARTEVHAVTQYGTMQGYKQAGLSTKIWVAVLDEATRDSHVAVDGEEVPIDAAFSNGLMFPGDPAGSAEEIINCRCVI